MTHLIATFIRRFFSHYLPVQKGLATNTILAYRDVVKMLLCCAADALKLVAGKDLGSSPFAWHHWFRQKIGTLTNADLERAYRNRTMRSRMNAP